MSNKLMMIQPGAFGDIIICAPVAKAYSDAGYEVYWPAKKKFRSIISKFDYVTFIELSDDIFSDDWLRDDVGKCISLYEEMNFDYALNLADRGPHPPAEMPDEMFDESKYRLAKVPFRLKHTLSWTRNKNSENKLFDLVVPGDEYILCHLECSGPSGIDGRVSLPISFDIPVVEVSIIEDYSIFDWYKVIKNAKEIYCLESSVQCFIDAIALELECPKYLLPRPTWINGKAPWKQSLGENIYGNTGSRQWLYDYMK
jgi:hypothetical protein